MKLLGLRLCQHDSNISYYDGEKFFYTKTERTYQAKHHALNNLWEWRDEIKRLWNVDYNDIDEVGIVVDPWHHNLPGNNEEFFPESDFEFLPTKSKVTRINHHYAHALSCFPVESKKSNVQVVIDGFGEKNNSFTIFKNDKILKRGYQDLSGSLGIEMCNAGKWLGINSPNSLDDPGKLMSLQSYGNIDYDFKNKISKYDLEEVNKMFNLSEWVEHQNSPLLANLKPLDWIKTVHLCVGEALIKLFEEITDGNYDETISYSGGCAQNIIWNTMLKNKFKNLTIPPHCADDGLSIGAVEYLRRKNNLKSIKIDNFPFIQSDEKPEKRITKETIRRTAILLSKGYVVAWYQGNGEIGPRALGNRSFLVNPFLSNSKEKINEIKQRENYRPFGASVLKEKQSKYFKSNFDDKYMLYTGEVIDKSLKSVTHIDGTCRFQTVDTDNKYFYDLLKEFEKLTGHGVLLNTSLNIAGKPIMSFREDAKDYFENSPKIDALVIGEDIWTKSHINESIFNV